MTLRTTLASWLACSLLASAQTDNFNDGNDDGWVRFDPLGGLGAGPIASFSFSEGAYRMTTIESPSPSQAGPSRASSLRPEVIYEDRLFLSVDLKIPDPNLLQATGFVFMVQGTPALGEVEGYTFNYQPVTQDIVINRIVDEQPIRLAATGLSAVAKDEVRLVMRYENGDFIGLLYNLDDLSNPIARLDVTDTTYTSGSAGIFVYADTDDATGGADVIFDNYEANALVVPQPELKIMVGGTFEISWPDWAMNYGLAVSPDLASDSWSLLDEMRIERREEAFVVESIFDADGPSFFRLQEKPL